MDKKYFYVLQSQDGIRIDKWLMITFNFLQNSIIQKWIRKGFVRVDGKKVAYNYNLSFNQVIEIPSIFLQNYKEEVIPKKDLNLNKYKSQIESIKDNILYKDDDFLIINKPAGLAVQGGSGLNFHLDMIFEKLKYESGVLPHIVHRIDKDTSGILVLARSKAVAKYMFELFKNKEVNKTYVAIVNNAYKLTNTEGEINAPLLKVGEDNSQRVMIDKSGKQAFTHYKILQKVEDFAYMELSPKTGRTHQLRVHLADYLKVHIVGDYKYGYCKNLEYKNINQSYMYLHSSKISFKGIYGNIINIEAPLPKYFVDFLDNIFI